MSLRSSGLCLSRHPSLNVSTTPVLVGIIDSWIGLVVIDRTRRILGPRAGRGGAPARTHDEALGRMCSMPVGMSHGSGIGGGAQTDQEAQGQKRAHRISPIELQRYLPGVPVAPSQSVGASRSITSAASVVPTLARNSPAGDPLDRGLLHSRSGRNRHGRRVARAILHALDGDRPKRARSRRTRPRSAATPGLRGWPWRGVAWSHRESGSHGDPWPIAN